MEKRIKIEIAQDGTIKAETIGIKGKNCLPYISMLENLLSAETVDSAYTHEYHEASIESKQQQVHDTLRKE
ncbi:hypothetical protein WQ57_01610 [Mesobacillus campisalis]|uniref:DUF2997 domain-containing protein n=1 Tax=Mesobacillus campisalis TaxID=1408103 RepID=A0A0M2T407_9BACI|nr:DUF2997 domain-containing protein [Mesobacillus campisalis]KKK39992.1 hypothetical protein WQ57_01610 [Mesobacillus campisalis]